jgi:hypothetical protein
MPPDLFDTAVGILRLSATFVLALFLPLLLQLALLYFAGWALRKLVFFVSRTLAVLLGLVGTPVHEFSHAIANLITLCGVAAITPLIDKTGQASVYAKRSHFLGDMLAGVAPLFGGMLVLWLTGVYIIPGFEVPTISPPQLDMEAAASFGTVLRSAMDYLGQFLQTVFQDLPHLQWENWRTYVGLYVALSIGFSLPPSDVDLKGFARGLPVAVVLVLGLFAWLYFSGDAEVRFLALQQTLVPRLLDFSTAVTYAFLLTSLGILVFLPLRLWQVLGRN